MLNIFSCAYLPSVYISLGKMTVYVFSPFSFSFCFIKVLFKKNFLMFIFERERQSTREGRAEREGDQNPKQVPGSELSVQSLTWGLNPRTTRLCPEPKLEA